MSKFHANEATISGITAIFWCLITVFLMISGLTLLCKKYRNKGTVRYREWRLTFSFSILILSECIINRTYFMCYGVWKYCDYPILSVTLLNSLFISSIYSLHAIRIWKLYYIHQCNKAIADNIWVQQIKNIKQTPPTSLKRMRSKQRLKQLENNWFIQNRNTWGNTLFLMIIYIPFIILSMFICIMLSIFFNLHQTNFIWMLIPSIFSIYMIYCARNIVDVYGIYKELLYSTILNTSVFMAYFIHFILFHILSFQINEQINWLLYNFYGSLGISILGLITTWFPIYWYKHMKFGKDGSYEQIQQLSFKDILANWIGFRIFINYLINELCAEALLFIVELVQIKNYFNNDLTTFSIDERMHHIKSQISATFIDKYATQNNTTSSDDKYNTQCDFTSIQLPIELPLSCIIIQKQQFKNDINNSIDASKAMIYIYNKYLSSSALYPLAVSYENMQQIKRGLFGPNLESIQKTINTPEYSESLNAAPYSLKNLKVNVSQKSLQFPPCDNGITPLPMPNVPRLEQLPSGIEVNNSQTYVSVDLINYISDNKYNEECELEKGETLRSNVSETLGTLTVIGTNECIDNELTDDIYNMNIQQILTLYDNVAIELLYCLHDAFIRFQTSVNYHTEFSKRPSVEMLDIQDDVIDEKLN